jgi:hypothetical protein
VRAPVADEQPHPWVLQDVTIFAFEIRRGFNHLRGDLDDVEMLYLARRKDSIGGDPAAEADDECVAGLLMHQSREQPEQSLSEHVAAV